MAESGRAVQPQSSKLHSPPAAGPMTARTRQTRCADPDWHRSRRGTASRPAPGGPRMQRARDPGRQTTDTIAFYIRTRGSQCNKRPATRRASGRAGERAERRVRRSPEHAGAGWHRGYIDCSIILFRGLPALWIELISFHLKEGS